MNLLRPIHVLSFATLCLCIAPVMSQTMSREPSPTMTREAGLARADVSFLKQAAENGHAEIESSKLALEKGSSPEVREFAQAVINDHERIGSELKTLAAAKAVELPERPSLMQRGKMKLTLSGDGQAFERRYIQSMGVGTHEDTIELFEEAASKAEDAEIKAFAEKTLPVLRNHLTQAQALQAKFEAESAAARQSPPRPANGGQIAPAPMTPAPTAPAPAMPAPQKP